MIQLALIWESDHIMDWREFYKMFIKEIEVFKKYIYLQLVINAAMDRAFHQLAT